MFSPFEHTEIKKLFGDLLDTLFDESGRGAVLIATTHVDDHLTKLIESILPPDISKNQKDRAFKYPGQLSSFSSKIELAYVFRLINKNLYDSLNALRKIRNDAAHSHSKFELNDLNEQLKQVYDLGPGIPSFIKDVSSKALIQSKMDIVKKNLNESDIPEESKNEIFEKKFKGNKDTVEALEKQVPFWELAFGLSLLCGLIVYFKDKHTLLVKDMNIWSDLVKDANETEDTNGS